MRQEVFANREEAARLLAERLAPLRGSRPLVLAVPRGGVPMGRVLAEALDGDLDVVLVHKLGAPGNPEYALGAVSETGEVWLRDQARTLNVPPSFLEVEAEAQKALLTARRRRYTPARAPADPRGRTVIVVDDGVATGATLLAALRILRRRQPARLIAAVAVAPIETVKVLSEACDQVVCLHTPRFFEAVGQFFYDFAQVSDQEVIRTLRQCENRPVESRAGTGGGP